MTACRTQKTQLSEETIIAFLYWIHRKEQTDITTEGYVGITICSVEKRYGEHVSTSKNDEKRKHYPLYRAMRKYGVDSFVVDTVVEGSPEYVILLEKKLRPTPRIGYNIAIGGEATGKNREVSEETRAKISKTLTGKKHTPEQRAHKSQYQKGRKQPEGFGDGVRERQLGRKLDPEWCANISRAKKETACRMWESHSANKEVWVLAADAYLCFLSKPLRDTERSFGLSKNQMGTMFKAFKSGWIPQEDPAWLRFKEQYLTEQTNEQT